MSNNKVTFTEQYKNFVVSNFSQLPISVRWVLFLPISIIIMVLVNAIGVFMYYSIYDRVEGFFTAFIVNGVAVWIFLLTLWLTAPKYKQRILYFGIGIFTLLATINLLFNNLLLGSLSLISTAIASWVVYKDSKELSLDIAPNAPTFENPLDTEKIKRIAKVIGVIVLLFMLLLVFLSLAM